MRKISFEIKELGNLMHRNFRKYINPPFEQHGITGMNAAVIHYLIKRPDKDIFQKDLERDFSIRKSTVSKMLLTMEEKGLIYRLAVPYDARLKRIVLTQEAIDLHDGIFATMEQMEDKMIRDISDDELSLFLEVIHKMKANLEVNLQEDNKTC